MGDAASVLRNLPRVDDILDHPRLSQGDRPAPRSLARRAARQAIEEARSRILRSTGLSLCSICVTPDSIAARAAEILRREAVPSLRRAINATGTVLHTGLGRAPLSAAAQAALAEAAAGYSNVQIDLESGGRSHREDHIQWLLAEITAAPAVARSLCDRHPGPQVARPPKEAATAAEGLAGLGALVVNNNAAATVLVLNTLAAGREVIVSRGEMVEIGGAFRIPEIMALAGCRLVEVGCTNRTHLRDYERALTPDTALILSVHQSNYRIEGFAHQVPVGELAALAHARGLVCAHDLGSGALLDLRDLGLPHEPSAPESLAAGADVVFFSGDKLLGGPQCGIILGRPDLLDAMRRNPYYRTFRVDKLTLAALEATLRLFLEPERLPEEHRLLSVLTCSLDTIRGRAQALARGLGGSCGGWLAAETCDGESAIGGGSLAGHALPTMVVRLRSDKLAAEELARRLRLEEPPIIARVHEDAVLLDARTILPGEDDLILAALQRIGKAL
jgi:L-seryl-tRNA(Ser) seleniumtransferase